MTEKQLKFGITYDDSNVYPKDGGEFSQESKNILKEKIAGKGFSSKDGYIGVKFGHDLIDDFDNGIYFEAAIEVTKEELNDFINKYDNYTDLDASFDDFYQLGYDFKPVIADFVKEILKKKGIKEELDANVIPMNYTMYENKDHRSKDGFKNYYGGEVI